VGADQVRVLVLYSHPLLGEGLMRMLGDVDDLDVVAVSVESEEALAAALASHPTVIVLEEGGPLGARELLARTDCPVVVDVDISSAEAWSYRRDSIRSRPDEVLAAIVASGRAAMAGADDGPDRASLAPSIRPVPAAH
jgi:DNA-binding NarL/FixJ family response regulator